LRELARDRRRWVTAAVVVAALATTTALLVRFPGDLHLWEGLGLGLLLGAGALALRRPRPRSGAHGAAAAVTGSGPDRRSRAAPGAADEAAAARVREGPAASPGELVSQGESAARAPAFGPGGRVLILASAGLSSELAGAVEGWGGAAERVEGTTRALTRLLTAAEGAAPYRAVVVERARLQVRPAEFLAAVREEPALRELRAVLLDPAASRAEDTNLRRVGYAGVLGLPLDKTLLFNALHGSGGELRTAGNAVSLASYYRQRLQVRATRVLVADDSAISRNALKTILERADYLVHVAGDGEEALDVLARGRPQVDLVILDVRMPGRSGLDVLRAYRYMQPDTAAPVVMLTSESSPDVREACLRAGASAFLRKPVDPQALLAVLAGLDTRRPPVGPPAALAPVSGSGPAPRARLDEATLEGLRRLGREAGFLNVLVEGFIREGRQALTRVEQAVADGDHARLLDALQALRGASGDIGARDVASLCERLQEVPGERLGSPRVTLLVEALGRAFDASAVALTEFLERGEDAAR
jgi:two-component system sensor histidine kinase RpfC